MQQPEYRKIEITSNEAVSLPEMPCSSVSLRNMHKDDTVFFIGQSSPPEFRPSNGHGFELRSEDSMVIHLVGDSTLNKSSQIAIATNKECTEILVLFV